MYVFVLLQHNTRRWNRWEPVQVYFDKADANAAFKDARSRGLSARISGVPLNAGKHQHCFNVEPSDDAA